MYQITTRIHNKTKAKNYTNQSLIMVYSQKKTNQTNKQTKTNNKKQTNNNNKKLTNKKQKKGEKKGSFLYCELTHFSGKPAFILHLQQLTGRGKPRRVNDGTKDECSDSTRDE